MISSLGGGVYVNVKHISLLSGVQNVDNRPNAFQIRLILMGNKEHVVIGTEQVIRQLHESIKNALRQMDAAASNPA
jgi:hypothetical protein